MTLNDHLERFVESEMNEIELSIAQLRDEKLWDTLSYTEDQLEKNYQLGQAFPTLEKQGFPTLEKRNLLDRGFPTNQPTVGNPVLDADSGNFTDSRDTATLKFIALESRSGRSVT